jgi:hypothetical protein
MACILVCRHKLPLSWPAADLHRILLPLQRPPPPASSQYISNAITTPPQTDDSDAAKFTQNLVK